MWDFEGGCDIYNNTFYGGGTLDIAGNYLRKTTYAYSVKIYGNKFLISNQLLFNPHQVIGICVEAFTDIDGIWIYGNQIKNFGVGIQMTQGNAGTKYMQNIYIYHNVFENIGYSDLANDYGSGIEVSWQAPVSYMDNINILNNTIAGTTAYGIKWDVFTTNTNITIKNNIISGFRSYGIYFRDELPYYGGSVSGSQTNNIVYNSSTITFTAGVTHSGYTNSGNLTSNPVFVSSSDFHLQSTSPAINAGTTVTLPTANVDYDLVLIGTPSEIGAYEYGTSVTSPTVTTTDISSITTTTAVSGGTIVSNGGSSITLSGICWGTTVNPTTANSKTIDGTTSGNWADNITGLTQNTGYHVRAYATNAVGTSYGSDRQFTSLLPTSTYKVKYNGKFVKAGGKILIVTQ
jgi:hypothetical protein